MDRKYMIDTQENKQFLYEMREDLLTFGKDFASPGGSSYWLGDDGTPWKERPRETFITSRMAHVYSIGHLMGHEGNKELAQKAINGLRGELRDVTNGGWYSGLKEDGSPLEGKLCYAHAFVILAASSGILAGCEGAEELLKDALAEYDKYFWEEEIGLSCDNWNTEFTEKNPYRGLNANMHTVESFLAAADVTGDEKYRIRAGRIIDRVIGWASDNAWRIPEHYTSDWEPDYECSKDNKEDGFKPYGATPGHGLEWARLITQWALSTFKDDTAKAENYIDAAQALCRRALNDAWDCDGAPGIVYTVDWEGKPIVRDRMHWVLAEAIDTTGVLYHVTKDEWYADFYAVLMEYLDDKMLDHVNGSWFHQLDTDNVVTGSVWPGKMDLYHAFQATLLPYSRPDVSIAAAMKQ